VCVLSNSPTDHVIYTGTKIAIGIIALLSFLILMKKSASTHIIPQLIWIGIGITGSIGCILLPKLIKGVTLRYLWFNHPKTIVFAILMAFGYFAAVFYIHLRKLILLLRKKIPTMDQPLWVFQYKNELFCVVVIHYLSLTSHFIAFKVFIIRRYFVD